MPWTKSPPPRTVWLLAGGLLAVHMVLAWLARQPAILTGQDDAYYLILGQALRHLRYVDLFEVGAPAHYQYPPGYPAFLALWGALVGDRWAWLVVPSILASAAALLFVFDVLRRRWAPAPALACLAALAVNPSVIDLAGQLRTEAPFTALVAGSLWAADRGEDDRRARWLALAGALAVLAALTRTIGAALIVALVVLWVVRRRPRAAAVLVAASLVTAGGWLARSFTAPQQYAGASYAADFTTTPESPRVAGRQEARPSFAAVLARRVRTNAQEYLGTRFPYRLPFPTIPGTPIDNAVFALVTAVGMITGLLVWLRVWPGAALFVAGYCAVLVIWPWSTGRFVIPLLPFLVPAVLSGADWLAARVGPRLQVGTLAVLAALLLITGARGSAALAARGLRCQMRGDLPSPSCVTPDQASYFAAMDYIRRHTPPDAVFLAMKPQPLFHYTGRRSVNRDAAMRVPPDSMAAYLDRHAVTYVLLASLQAAELDRIPARLEPHCDRLELVQQFPPRTYLFKLRPAPGDGGPACAALAEHRRLNEGRDFETEPDR